MRLIHTADWQIGKSFGLFTEEIRQALRDERLEAVTRIGNLARQHGVGTVLVAGDIYDVTSPADRTLRQPMERMRAFSAITWHLVPGNHDAHTPAGPWLRLLRTELPQNVIVHLDPKPVALCDGEAWLLPSVLTRRHAGGDPTEHMDTSVTPDGVIRIGMAHGSITSFGSDPASTHNLIARDRPERAGLAYLALGDYHGAQQQGARSWYAGTPEPDGFDLGGRGGGEVLLVEIGGPHALPFVSYLTSGRFRWQHETAALDNAAGIAALEVRLRNLDPEPSRMLVQLKAAGALSVVDRGLFDRLIRDGVGSAVRALRLDDDGLILQPTAADLAALTRAGSVGVAAERLQQRANEAADPQQALASAALQRLYLLHAAHTRSI